MKNSNLKSAYAARAINNRHEYGPASNRIRLIQQWNKNSHLIHWENHYIQERETNTRTNDPQPQHPVQSGNMQKRKQTATYNVATRESQTVAHHTA